MPSPEEPVARPHDSEHLPAPRTRTTLSLFEGDLVNRLFNLVGLHGRRGIDLLLRCVCVISATWGVVAVAALFVTDVSDVPVSENFFKDFAAYLMLIVGLPLFVIAEPIVGEHTREAANYFLAAGVIPAADTPILETLHRRVARLRKSFLPELLCLAVAYGLAISTIWPKTASVCPTWHTAPVTEHNTVGERREARQKQRTACDQEMKRRDRKHAAGDETAKSAERVILLWPDLLPAIVQANADEEEAEPEHTPSKLNLAGWCEMLIALPILNYWWLRWIWKIGLWSWYLWRVSRLRLVLTPSHPDATGGLGFISDVQTKFGLVILAYGISNIASTVGYEIGVEHASWSLYTVWCPLLIFIIGAPSLFTLPLFMFTKQLYRVKKRAREQLYEKTGERARAFQTVWQKAENGTALRADLLEWQQLRNLYEHIEKMRIVPFDLRSFAELVGQTVGSLVPLLAYLKLPEPLMKLLEQSSHVFH
jgi:hypothetical protein